MLKYGLFRACRFALVKGPARNVESGDWYP
jgi:hypothetical protein